MEMEEGVRDFELLTAGVTLEEREDILTKLAASKAVEDDLLDMIVEG